MSHFVLERRNLSRLLLSPFVTVNAFKPRSVKTFRATPIFSALSVLALSNTLLGATFTYLENNAVNDGLEVYSSEANLASGSFTGGSNNTFTWDVSGIVGMAFDGSNYVGLFGATPVKYTSLENLRTNTQVAGLDDGWTSVASLFGVAAEAEGGKYYVLWDDDGGFNDRIFEYSSESNFLNASSSTIHTATWDFTDATNGNVTGFGHDGTAFYVTINDGDATPGDVVRSYPTLNDLINDTNSSSTSFTTGPNLDLNVALAVDPAPVPEPTTYAVISGLLLWGFAAIRRRKQA